MVGTIESGDADKAAAAVRAHLPCQPWLSDGDVQAEGLRSTSGANQACSELSDSTTTSSSRRPHSRRSLRAHRFWATNSPLTDCQWRNCVRPDGSDARPKPRWNRLCRHVTRRHYGALVPRGWPCHECGVNPRWSFNDHAPSAGALRRRHCLKAVRVKARDGNGADQDRTARAGRAHMRKACSEALNGEMTSHDRGDY
jgi:hypothetical protein